MLLVASAPAARGLLRVTCQFLPPTGSVPRSQSGRSSIPVAFRQIEYEVLHLHRGQIESALVMILDAPRRGQDRATAEIPGQLVLSSTMHTIMDRPLEILIEPHCARERRPALARRWRQ